MTINMTLTESKFVLNLDHNQIGMIIDALIDKAGSETYDPLAKQFLTLADEMQRSLAAGLEERSKSYCSMQIKHRLEAFDK